MSAQVVPNRPKISAPLAGSPTTKLTTRQGSTGIMMPNPRVSKRTVAKMNTRAALLGWDLVAVSRMGDSWASSVKSWTLFFGCLEVRKGGLISKHPKNSVHDLTELAQESPIRSEEHTSELQSL